MVLGLGLGLGLNLGILNRQLGFEFNIDAIIDAYNDPNISEVVIRQQVTSCDLAYILMNIWAENYLDKYKDDSVEAVEIDTIGCEGLLCLLEKIYKYNRE